MLPHIRIHPQCGACGMSFQEGSKITALTYYRDACVTLDAGSYQDSEIYQQIHPSYSFCGFPHCSGCELMSESITCHTDCLNIIKRLSNGTLQRLWVAATWRYPWPHSSPLLLPSEDPIEDCIQMASDACEFPLLTKLPNEIKTMIIQLCGPHLLWRYASSTKLMKELESAPNSTTLLLPLIEIESWHRGSEPVLSKDNYTDLIRLTIDARGLRDICRFSSPPEPEGLSTHSGHFLYIFKQATQLSHAKVKFEIGLGRLLIPDKTEFQLWDCPASPSPYCLMGTPRRTMDPYIKRFTTIDIKQCHGLTFFISCEGLSSIHPHTSRSPDAMKTFTTLTPRLQACSTWFYLPLGDHERFISLGLRFRLIDPFQLRPCFLVRLHSGEYLIGPLYTGRVITYTLPLEGRPFLIYENPEDRRISAIGASTTWVSPRENSPLPSTIPRERLPFTNASMNVHLATAPLTGVVAVKLFRSQTICKGIILTYSNKTQRALGQCRVGQDTEITYETPTGLYYASTLLETGDRERLWETLYVEIATQSCPKPEKDESLKWTFSTMSGIMKFFFNANQSSLTIERTGEHEG